MTHARRIALALTLAATAASARADTIDFSGLTFNSASPNYEDGQYLTTPGGFTTGGAFFSNSFSGGYGSDWAYSKVDDTTTAGPTNQYASIAGTAGNGTGIYGVANVDSQADGPPGAFINLPAGAAPVSAMITNTTYAYLSMTRGDSFAGPPFGTIGSPPGYTGPPLDGNDFLTLHIFGFTGADGAGTRVGEVDFPLASFTGGQGSIVNAWTYVNLSSLRGAESLGFSMEEEASRESTYFGTTYLNTPSYFAMESLTLGNAVPEPSSVVLIAVGFGILGAIARRTRASGTSP